MEPCPSKYQTNFIKVAPTIINNNNNIVSVIFTGTALRRNSLYGTVRFANFEGILGFSVPSIIFANLLGNNSYLHEFKRLWFVIRDWCISICFICFMFQDLLLCDCPVLGNNWRVKFASQIFLIILILVTCKNKTTSTCFLRQKIHSPSRFPTLFLSSLESFSVELGEHVTLWFALIPPSLKWLTEQKNSRLQYAQSDTTNFIVKLETLQSMSILAIQSNRRQGTVSLPKYSLN